MKLLALFLLCLSVRGVGPGTVFGIVTDSATGATITTEVTAIPGLVVTNSNGCYRAQFVNDGVYQINTAAPGYTTNIQAVMMRAGTLVRRDVRLAKVTP